MERKKDKLGDTRDLRIGEVLLHSGLITEAQLSEALEIQKTDKKKLGEILSEKGFISDNVLAEALAQEFRLPFIDLSKERIDKKIVAGFPAQALKKFRVFPVRVEDGHLIIATGDPLDIFGLQELSHLSGYPTKPAISSLRQIDLFINKYASGPMQAAADAIKEITAKKKEESFAGAEMSLKELEVAVQEAPVIKLVNSIIDEAIERRASDIHFEPQEKGLLVRFRVDGVLYEGMVIPPDLQPSVISRIKLISGMDIAERRKPQDGRISLNLGERNFDVRVSTLPSIFGEKTVLRLLDKKGILLSMDYLGLDKDELELIDRLIRQPYGIILITGPTGSGKTTTLYSILNTLNDASRSIVTVEEPVEYELPRVNQTSINIRAGYTFATAIRHILRQDPDVIMVGEIRDLETAEIAIQAALTGHLVLSTLHTNSAAGSVTRLLDMNVEPFLVSSAVVGVIAQRLVRKLCPYCKKEYVLGDDLKKEITDLLLPAEKEKLILNRPMGCDRCHGMGYFGRTGIFEILKMTEGIKNLVLRRASESEISKVAVSEGMRTLRADGVKKVQEGVTSLEEVMRVAFVKEI